MRAVRSRDTVPELRLRAALRRLGISGYRIDVKSVPGRPDVAFTRSRLAVFVDGAYWHGRLDRVRPGRSEYWDDKIERNRARDRRNTAMLREDGWRVLRLWDDEVLKDPDGSALRVLKRLRARPMAEFFAGIGLVGMGLEEAGFLVVFANDIDPSKRALYTANIDSPRFKLGDIRSVRGSEVPSVELATASFPCTDLSLAGGRVGLNGKHSGTFWEFARILAEMGERKPKALLIENVAGFASSRSGEDLALAVKGLNELGYFCDLIQLDAQHWVPQSRQRMFIVGSLERLANPTEWRTSSVRPSSLIRFAVEHPTLMLQAAALPKLPAREATLADTVEQLPSADPRWWATERVAAFVLSLSPTQNARLRKLKESPEVDWRTAYRRTRFGKAVWEIRNDSIAGCLRTSRGGSSRQALVEAGNNGLRIRWMTSREYARLMGVPDYDVSAVTENKALFGLGDAVCVPAITWLGEHYLIPLLSGHLTKASGEPIGATP